MESRFRNLPGVDKVLADKRLERLVGDYPRERLVSLVRRQLERARAAVAAGKPAGSPDEIVSAVLAELKALTEPGPRRVINAAGVILHTNLGRAPLSPEAIAAMAAVSSGYSNLEINMNTGARGSRHVHVEGLLGEITGAEAGFVVNNNAAGVLLGLTALARRREVIVSRGQAVEIGGGFRIPDVMRQSGARLVEVGTTNCTYAADYENAIGERTAALMRVHSSNFKLEGFVSEVSLDEIIAVARQHDLIVLDDLGSGCFLDTTVYGLAAEPMVQNSISSGAALTFFSGDKLVGGPQAGVIVGKKDYVDKLKRHPLARAVRVDKTRLAGMAATLVHYLKGEAASKIPVWRMIAADADDIKKRAAAWAEAAGSGAKVLPGETMVGGGSLPGGSLPTHLLALAYDSGGAVKRAAAALRARQVPVIGRIENDALLLDPRTVLPEEDDVVLAALKDLSASLS